MCWSMDSSTSRRTGGPKRRRSRSFSSAASRFSASSSSTSRSSLRVTRKVCTPSTSMPGNSRLRCSPMTSSSGTNRWLPTDTNRSKIGGTFTRAKCSLPVFGLRTSTAMLSESPEMYGNGCAGSTASGVSTGKTRSLKSFLHCFCSSRVRSSQRTSSMFSFARLGTITSRNSAACRASSTDVVPQMCSSTSRGSSPDVVGTASPAAIRRLRPATRTMKNSSRFEAKMARNRTRSSSGRPASSASSRTRVLKCSHDISRSRNRSCGRSGASTSYSGSTSKESWGTDRRSVGPSSEVPPTWWASEPPALVSAVMQPMLPPPGGPRVPTGGQAVRAYCTWVSSGAWVNPSRS